MVERARPASVLMTADTLGGVWSYTLRLASLLGERGTKVAIAAMGDPPSEAQERAARAVPGAELFSAPFRLEWMDDPWRDVDRAGEWLLELEAWLAPDVVHLNTIAHAALSFRAPAVAVAHSCVLSWWRAVRGEEAPPRYDEYRARLTRGVARASALVAPTRAMLAAAVRDYGPPKVSRVIANASYPAAFTPRAKERMVVSLGRLWDDAKNAAALAAAAPRVNAPIVVAGEVRHPNGTRADVTSLHHLGTLPEGAVRALLESAAIYAHPALYEPFGLSVL